MEKQFVTKKLALLLGLVTLLLPQSLTALEAKLSLDNDRFVVGQKFNVNILADTPDPLQLKLAPVTFPSELELTSGPFVRETSWENSSGQVTNGTKMTLSFRVIKTGIVTLGPFTITYGSQSFLVSPKTLYLLAQDESQNRFPLQVGWFIPPGPYFLGEGIPVILQVKNLETLIQPSELDVSAPANTLWEKAANIGDIEVTAVGDDRILTLPWSGWMMIPTQVGTINLPAVTVNVNGLVRTTSPLSLNIQAIPTVVTTRAIGDFSYEARIERSTQNSGQVTVEQIVRGRGNFPYLVLPEVTATGLRLINKQETAGYRPTTSGYQGDLTVTWLFAADHAGSYTVQVPPFVSYQPSLDKVWTWEPKSETLNLGNAGKVTAKPVLVLNPLKKNEWSKVLPWNLTERFWFWLAFLPGPFLFFLTFLEHKGRGKGLLVLLPIGFFLMSAAGQPLQHQPQGGTTEVNSVPSNETQPAYWYNEGLKQKQEKQTALAVRSFSRALALGFQGPQALTALREVEKEAQLTDQFQVWQGPSTDLFWILVLVSWNVAFFFWAWHRHTGKVSWIIPMTVAFFIFSASGITAGISLAERSPGDAVVGTGDAPLRRVPSDLAENWLTVPQGTIVRYQGISGPYALVTTGYGLQGWLKVNYLLPIQD